MDEAGVYLIRRARTEKQKEFTNNALQAAHRHAESAKIRMERN